MYLVHRGVDGYKEIKDKKGKFQEIEGLKVEQWNNYTQYGGYGFRLYFMPSALSIFFNNINLFAEVTAHIDVGEKINIYKSFKGKEVFVQKPGRYLDFSGLILLFGSLMALFYGHDALKHREFLKFLASLYGRRQVFSYIRLARLILLCGYFAIVSGCALLLVKIRGITLSANDLNHLLVFLILMLVILVFSFTMGTVVGSINIKPKLKGVVIIFTWLIFVYICPVGVSTFVEERAHDLPSIYTSELKKLTILMAFEDEVNITEQILDETSKKIQSEKIKTLDALREFLGKEKQITQTRLKLFKTLKSIQSQPIDSAAAIFLTRRLETLKDLETTLEKDFENKKPGKFDITSVLKNLKYEITKKMLDEFEREEFPKIQAEEITITTDMAPNIRDQRNSFAIFPSTFYLVVNIEISTRGYRSISEFHKYAKKVKDEFLGFYIRGRLAELKAAINEERVSGVESFFENRSDLSNVFEGDCQLPSNFLLGILITSIWILAALYLSYYLYNKSLFSLRKEDVIGLDDLEIELNKGESNAVLSRKKLTVSNHLYNVLSGKNKKFKGKVLLQGVNLAAEKKEIEFIYLCQPDEIPEEIRVKDLISFIAGTLNMTPDQVQELKTKLNVNELGGKNFGDLDLEERDKGKILLEIVLLKHSNIYMIYDFTKGMPMDFIQEFVERLEKLKQSGVSILYVTNDFFLGRKIGDYVSVSKEDAALMITNF
jgi:ABC-type Na+ transport system ATPase subunit NatA